jgi:hypothetical protein
MRTGLTRATAVVVTLRRLGVMSAPVVLDVVVVLALTTLARSPGARAAATVVPTTTTATIFLRHDYTSNHYPQ